VLDKERKDREELILGELRGEASASGSALVEELVLTWLRKVYRNLIASTTRIGCTEPGAACRSEKTFWPKKSTTSTRTLVDVTPSCQKVSGLTQPSIMV
jgi:hypothetical protein